MLLTSILLISNNIHKFSNLKIIQLCLSMYNLLNLKRKNFMPIKLNNFVLNFYQQ